MHMFHQLACELMDIFDGRGAPPTPDKVSKSMRGEMAVLRLLRREAKVMAAGEISTALNMTTPRIAAVLKSLEKKNLIERYADEADKRRVMVRLTASGEEFCLKRKQEATAHMEKILFHLGKEDAAEYVRLMKRLHEILPLVGPPAHDEPGEKEAANE